MNWALATFLIIDALISGAVAVLAAQHGLAHFRPDKHDADKLRPKPETGHLPPEIRRDMQEKARASFDATIDKYTSQLQKDLQASEANLSARLDKLSADIINKESASYKQELGDIGKEITSVNKSTEAELRAKLDEELAAEKQRRIAQLDTKLTDAVTSFLLETLGHEVDLGAQNKYLLAQLEAHKSEIIEGVKNGA